MAIHDVTCTSCDMMQFPPSQEWGSGGGRGHQGEHRSTGGHRRKMISTFFCINPIHDSKIQVIRLKMPLSHGILGRLKEPVI